MSVCSDSLGYMRIPDPHPGSWVDGQPHDCHITRDSVVIDGTPVPGPIASAGVSVKGGGYDATGRAALNIVTIELLVGAIDIDDDAVQAIEVHLPRTINDD
jgi:hypothetical protein